LQFLITQCIATAEGDAQKVRAIVSGMDRWGGTPLSDAKYHGHIECVQLLFDAGASEARSASSYNLTADILNPAHARQGAKAKDAATAAAAANLSNVSSDCDAPALLWPASTGDIDTLVRLSAAGEDFSQRDYDFRTALHLAASNGQLGAVRYILGQATDRDARHVLASAQDRWGRTPMEDAVTFNGGGSECVALLRQLVFEDV
jgi:ankyrin repeat protein